MDDPAEGASITLQKSLIQELKKAEYDPYEPEDAKHQALLEIGNRIRGGEIHLFDSGHEEDHTIFYFLFQNTATPWTF